MLGGLPAAIGVPVSWLRVGTVEPFTVTLTQCVDGSYGCFGSSAHPALVSVTAKERVFNASSRPNVSTLKSVRVWRPLLPTLNGALYTWQAVSLAAKLHAGLSMA